MKILLYNAPGLLYIAIAMGRRKETGMTQVIRRAASACPRFHLMPGENGFIEIASVLVNPEILTRPYSCDVEKYGCRSMCCYRSCIVPPDEARRVEAHLDGILSYLSPDNREAIRKNGSILGVCAEQCPQGCVIHEDEARAIRRNFGSREFRCILLFGNDCSLLYSAGNGRRFCAVHSYALEHGMDWETFKFADCVQYPLSFYVREDGKQVMTIQDTPYLAHIPCMKDPSGEPLYRGLRRTIETFLGREFYRELAACAESLSVKQRSAGPKGTRSPYRPEEGRAG